MFFPKPLSSYHPILYKTIIGLRRFQRKLYWWFDSKKYASEKSENPLPFRIKKHQSVLIRKLGDSELQLQHNKVQNLKLASKEISGILIKPGQTFSFCKTVGLPTKEKGYLLGMELSNGKAIQGIGGGICQIANLIHWLTIHSPLQVTERYHHSFDPFPDEGRVMPFGSGATIFYNYKDFQITNNTKHTFQINIWFTEKCIEGDLRIDTELDYSYHVFEKEHSFLKINDEYYRKNEIWRNKILKFEGGKIIDTEMITKNFSRVMYTPKEFDKNSCY